MSLILGNKPVNNIILDNNCVLVPICSMYHKIISN